MLAVMFLMTGPMKLLVPTLAEAWAGQLVAAQLPFFELSRWTVPFIELSLGAILAIGIFVRLAALAVTGIMVVATYVHVIVDDPSLFPLQPSEPIHHPGYDHRGKHLPPVAGRRDLEQGPGIDWRCLIGQSLLDELIAENAQEGGEIQTAGSTMQRRPGSFSTSI